MALFKFLRTGLDVLYKFAGYLAAVFLILILFFVASQMVARWGGGILALPYALNSGSHIRVSLLLTALGRYRKFGEIWCWAIASYLTFLFARYAIKFTYESYRFNEISQGHDAWPIWIPQMSMAIGTVLLAICAFDNLVTTLLTGRDNIHAPGTKAQEE